MHYGVMLKMKMIEKVKSLLEVHGECSPQHPSDWYGDFELPQALYEFYKDIGPLDISIPGYGNPTEIYSLSNLCERQVGYRWHGKTKEELEGWNHNWIVVADEGADPYIYDGSRVLFAVHGTGSWEADILYSDLLKMAGSLAILGTIVVEAGEDFVDEDCLIKDNYRDLAIERLTDLLGSSSEAEVVLETAGWE